ncbi:MAG: cation transporter [Victivallales bacterium]|jgi:divalent metal cation (Fe/Co/Zn/Cd) transporter
MPEQSLNPVIRYLRHIIGYEAFMALTAGAVVYHASSHTAVFPLLFAVGGVLCLILMLHTVKAAAKGDTYHYPYGTGRLENLSSILLSTMIAVGAMIPFVQAVQALFSDKPHAANMGWTSLLLLVSCLGNLVQGRRALRLHKSNGSPILSSIYHGYHTGFVRDGFSFALIGICWSLKGENQEFMSLLDSISTIALTFYTLYHLLPQVWINFRSLADFPTSEENQLKIMGILARHYDRYEMLGLIYTAKKGGTEVFEVELSFKPEMNIGELLELENEIRQDFRKQFPDCLFRIIPQLLPMENPSSKAQPQNNV